MWWEKFDKFYNGGIKKRKTMYKKTIYLKK